MSNRAAFKCNEKSEFSKEMGQTALRDLWRRFHEPITPDTEANKLVGMVSLQEDQRAPYEPALTYLMLETESGGQIVGVGESEVLANQHLTSKAVRPRSPEVQV